MKTWLSASRRAFRGRYGILSLAAAPWTDDITAYLFRTGFRAGRVNQSRTNMPAKVR